RHDVPDREMVFDQDEDACDDVLHQRLRTEADGQADDPRAGEKWPDVDAYLGEDDQGGDQSEKYERDPLQQGQEGFRTSRAFDDVAVLVSLAEIAVDRGTDDLPNEQRDEHDRQNLGDAADEVLARLGGGPAEGVDPPSGEDAQERDEIDARQQDHLQGGEVSVGMFLETGEPLVQLRADGETPS